MHQHPSPAGAGKIVDRVDVPQSPQRQQIDRQVDGVGGEWRWGIPVGIQEVSGELGKVDGGSNVVVRSVGNIRLYQKVDGHSTLNAKTTNGYIQIDQKIDGNSGAALDAPNGRVVIWQKVDSTALDPSELVAKVGAAVLEGGLLGPLGIGVALAVGGPLTTNNISVVRIIHATDVWIGKVDGGSQLLISEATGVVHFGTTDGVGDLFDTERTYHNDGDVGKIAGNAWVEITTNYGGSIVISEGVENDATAKLFVLEGDKANPITTGTIEVGQITDNATIEWIAPSPIVFRHPPGRGAKVFQDRPPTRPERPKEQFPC